MGVSFTSNIGGWSKTPLWRVFRFLAIWTAVLAIPRAFMTDMTFAELDVVETAAWLFGLAGDVWRWFGEQTSWW
jgi:hypothetical protein